MGAILKILWKHCPVYTGEPPGCQGLSTQRPKAIESLDVGEYRKMHLWGPKQKYWVLPGTWVRRLYGFGTSGWIGTTAPFTAPKSCTNWFSLLGFCAGRIGVSQGNWQGGNGHEFEHALGVGIGQGSLACCSTWGRKESDTTERLNWAELNWIFLSFH